MKAMSILEELRSHQPHDTAERESLDMILSSMHLAAGLFERTCLPGHFTASCWIVTPDGNQALLLFHRKLRKWLQPGGHADGDENLLRVALKEAKEETGLDSLRVVGSRIFDVDAHLIPESSSLPAHYHFDVRYLFVAAHDSHVIESDESAGIRWVPLIELDELGCDTGMLRMRDKTLSSLKMFGSIAQ